LIGPCQLALRFEVREQREMEVAVLGEGQVTPHAVYRDAHQLRVELPELREHGLIQRQLVGAHRAPVLRVERQDHGLPPELREHDLLIRGRGKLEVRRLLPGGQRGRVMDRGGLGHPLTPARVGPRRCRALRGDRSPPERCRERSWPPPPARRRGRARTRPAPPAASPRREHRSPRWRAGCREETSTAAPRRAADRWSLPPPVPPRLFRTTRWRTVGQPPRSSPPSRLLGLRRGLRRPRRPDPAVGSPPRYSSAALLS